MNIRVTLVLLLVLICAVTAVAQPHPLDPVAFDSAMYDAAQRLVEALDGALVTESDAWRPRRATRYEIAISALKALSLLASSEISAEEAAMQRLAEAWELLATEFLPEMIDAGVAYQPTFGATCPWPRLVSDDNLPHNLAIADLRAVPHDHWLYPATQRVLWEAMKAEGGNAPRWKTAFYWDTIPHDHWITQAALRLYEGLSGNAADRLLLPESGLRRDQIAMLAHDALLALVEIEYPTAEQQDLAVTWALLALELWPEIERVAGDKPLLAGGCDLLEDGWLDLIVKRVLEIAERNG